MSAPCATGSRSFSLTEVVVALGVSTVAIVSILGLFPLGFDTVRESEAETQAAILARTIFSDLKVGIRERGFTNSYLVAGKDLTNQGTWVDVNLATPGNYWIGLKKEIQAGQGGMIGNPYTLRAVKGGATGVPENAETSLDFLVGVNVEPQAPSLSQVSLQVEFPASVMRTNRMRQNFSWLVSP